MAPQTCGPASNHGDPRVRGDDRAAPLATMERVDLLDSVATAARAAEHAVQRETDHDETPRRDHLGEAGIHFTHLAHLLEAGETMGGHATSDLLHAVKPDAPTFGGLK